MNGGAVLLPCAQHLLYLSPPIKLALKGQFESCSDRREGFSNGEMMASFIA